MKRVLLINLILLVVLNVQVFAQGNLLVAPTRVVFEGNKQRQELNLVNMGKDTATYSISFIQYNMKEDGSYLIIDKPDSGQMFADPYLRVFPRKVTLAPAESQVVMVQCRRTSEMAAGEYRSHVYFRSENNYEPLGRKNSQMDTTKVSVQLIPVFGISIPVIIRIGTVNVKAGLSHLELETMQDSLPYLNLTLHRTGNISLFGNLVVEYIPLQGKPIEIGKVKGVKVYTNIDEIHVSVRLNKMPGMTFKNAKLRVRFINDDETKNSAVNAQSELDLRQ